MRSWLTSSSDIAKKPRQHAQSYDSYQPVMKSYPLSYITFRAERYSLFSASMSSQEPMIGWCHWESALLDSRIKDFYRFGQSFSFLNLHVSVHAFSYMALSVWQKGQRKQHRLIQLMENKTDWWRKKNNGRFEWRIGFESNHEPENRNRIELWGFLNRAPLLIRFMWDFRTGEKGNYEIIFKFYMHESLQKTKTVIWFTLLVIVLLFYFFC